MFSKSMLATILAASLLGAVVAPSAHAIQILNGAGQNGGGTNGGGLNGGGENGGGSNGGGVNGGGNNGGGVNGGGANGQTAQGAVIGASGVVVYAVELPASIR